MHLSYLEENFKFKRIKDTCKECLVIFLTHRIQCILDILNLKCQRNIEKSK